VPFAERNGLKDVCVVESISRLARSTADLLNIVKTLTDKGVEFESQKERIDTATPQGRFVLTVFAALAELEREVTAQRRTEGIAAAKARGAYKGRTPIKLDWPKFEEYYKKWKAGAITAVTFQREIKLPARTFYRKVAEYEQVPKRQKS
jgi:DNA invertase Pin-like site-specific DNA recombinase